MARGAPNGGGDGQALRPWRQGAGWGADRRGADGGGAERVPGARCTADESGEAMDAAAARGDADERPREPVVVEVHAARDGVRGRKEYYIEWSDGREGWEARPQSVSREVARRMATERAEYERAEAAGETMGLREMLIRQRGEGWMWLAAEAPKAVGRRDVRALVAEVKERGLHRGIAEEGGMEGAEAAVMEAEREAEAAREEVVARQRAAEAERGAMEARAEAATAARRAVAAGAGVYVAPQLLVAHWRAEYSHALIVPHVKARASRARSGGACWARGRVLAPHAHAPCPCSTAPSAGPVWQGPEDPEWPCTFSCMPASCVPLLAPWPLCASGGAC